MYRDVGLNDRLFDKFIYTPDFKYQYYAGCALNCGVNDDISSFRNRDVDKYVWTFQHSFGGGYYMQTNKAGQRLDLTLDMMQTSGKNWNDRISSFCWPTSSVAPNWCIGRTGKP